MLFSQEKKIVTTSTNYYVTAEGYYKCNFKNCELVSKSKSSIQVHSLIHVRLFDYFGQIGERHFACAFPGCTKKFFCQGNLNYHLNSHKSLKKKEEESGIKCVFEIEKKKKKRHQRYEFLCKYNKCRKVFPDSESFAAHKLEHAHIKYYKCYVKDCRHSYRQPSSLKKHLKLHFKSETDGFQCSHCPVSFSKFTTLLVHLRSHDDNGVLHKKRIFDCKNQENEQQEGLNELPAVTSFQEDGSSMYSSHLPLSEESTKTSQDSYFDFYSNLKNTFIYFQNNYDTYQATNKPSIEDCMEMILSAFNSNQDL